MRQFSHVDTEPITAAKSPEDDQRTFVLEFTIGMIYHRFDENNFAYKLYLIINIIKYYILLISAHMDQNR